MTEQRINPARECSLFFSTLLILFQPILALWQPCMGPTHFICEELVLPASHYTHQFTSTISGVRTSGKTHGTVETCVQHYSTQYPSPLDTSSCAATTQIVPPSRCGASAPEWTSCAAPGLYWRTLDVMCTVSGTEAVCLEYIVDYPGRSEIDNQVIVTLRPEIANIGSRTYVAANATLGWDSHLGYVELRHDENSGQLRGNKYGYDLTVGYEASLQTDTYAVSASLPLLPLLLLPRENSTNTHIVLDAEDNSTHQCYLFRECQDSDLTRLPEIPHVYSQTELTQPEESGWGHLPHINGLPSNPGCSHCSYRGQDSDDCEGQQAILLQATYAIGIMWAIFLVLTVGCLMVCCYTCYRKRGDN
jgi:hypothetical protein